MQVETRLYINSKPYLKRYIKEHSYWYKYINRDPNIIKRIEDDMEKEYKLTPGDKIEKLSNSIEMVANIIKIFN